MEFQEQEGKNLRLANIVKRLDERRRTDTTNVTLTQKITNIEWVGQNGLWKQKECPSTMNDMWGRLKQYYLKILIRTT